MGKPLRPRRRTRRIRFSTRLARLNLPVAIVLVVSAGADAETFKLELKRLDRQSASELISINDRFYELQISPTGDVITLTPSALPTGLVTFDCDRSQAVLYGEHGVVQVAGGKSQAVPMPVSEWRLLTYGIDLTPMARELAARSPTAPPAHPTILSTRGTNNTSTLRVEKGKTIPLPFGPPYRPVVTPLRSQGDWVWLDVRLIGRAGEVCEDLYVNGERPNPPRFAITGPNRKLVARGSFEYG
jgi:hypothetical protein